MEYTNIKLEKENAVATIRLNRPDALNALSPELLQEFSAAVADVRDDQSIKALVVRGEGRAFCSGADMIAMDAAFADQSRLSRYLDQMPAYSNWRGCLCPSSRWCTASSWPAGWSSCSPATWRSPPRTPESETNTSTSALCPAAALPSACPGVSGCNGPWSFLPRAGGYPAPRQRNGGW
ncbi:MAG: enoyl-CoA hydratase/isomerase family protein [Chloroflexi bacterium]|nr:enoyl-CoA hydratase/isomerase family protein [Chloroflexota bacterium]